MTRTNIKVTFAVATVTLILCFVFAIYSGNLLLTEHKKRITNGIAHSHLMGLNAALIDAETGQRGFLLTGTSSYLQPYNDALAKIEEIMHSLKSEEMNVFISSTDLNELEQLKQKKIDELKMTVNLYRENKLSTAIEIVRGNSGKIIMDEVRVKIASIQSKLAADTLKIDDNIILLTRLRTWGWIFLGVFDLLFVVFMYKRIQDESLRVAIATIAQKSAEIASHEKGEFLANMSHEIRTPLTAIIGFSELLQGSSLNESHRLRYARTIHRQSEYLKKLIDDILDLSKIEAGRLVVESFPCSLSTIVSNVVESLGPVARNKGIYLRVRNRNEVPDRITTDPFRLQQILLNVIGNAIKFTSSGGVTVFVEAKSLKQTGVELTISISDTGKGMSLDNQKKLFQPFEQGDSSIPRQYGGTGLGLVLSRRLAQALGGDVTLLKSAPDDGTIFKITIVSATAEGTFAVAGETNQIAGDESAATAGNDRLKGINILVAEDTPENQLLLGEILAANGATASFADNGREAIARAMAQDFDIVLMDMQMPVCDGFEATSELRRRGFKKPIIALTAATLQQDRERALGLGCEAFITKPIDFSALIGVILVFTSKV